MVRFRVLSRVYEPSARDRTHADHSPGNKHEWSFMHMTCVESQPENIASALELTDISNELKPLTFLKSYNIYLS
jgi:hypothetical protein